MLPKSPFPIQLQARIVPKSNLHEIWKPQSIQQLLCLEAECRSQGPGQVIHIADLRAHLGSVRQQQAVQLLQLLPRLFSQLRLALGQAHGFKAKGTHFSTGQRHHQS